MLDYSMSNMTRILVEDVQKYLKNNDKEREHKFTFIQNSYKDLNKKTQFIDEPEFNKKILEMSAEGKKIFIGCDTKANVLMY